MSQPRQTYNITAEVCSPVVLQQNRQSQRSNALSYIPGTALRGAIAGLYLRLGGAPDDEAFAALFLNERHARWGSLRAGPHLTPLTAQSCKRRPGFARGEGHGVYDTLITHLADVDTPPCPHPSHAQRTPERLRAFGAKPYSGESPGAGFEGEAAMIHAMHVGISRATQTASPGALYSQEGINPYTEGVGATLLFGQVSLGSTASESLRQLLEIMDNTVHIGRSHTRGKGKVRLRLEPVQAGPALDDLDAFSDAFTVGLQRACGGALPLRWRGLRFFTLGLPEGAVVVDRLLRHTNDLSAAVDWLPSSQHPPTSDRPGPVCLATHAPLKLLRGWNAAHGLPKADEWAIPPGAVYCYGVPDDQWPAAQARLAALAHDGVGLRRTEGLGRVIVSDPFHITMSPHLVSTQEAS